MHGRTVLITGGARGMGAETARALARQGAHVILVDWEGEAGTRLRDEINQAAHDGSAEFRYCDLSSLSQVMELATRVRRDHPALHVLINNAGITDPVRRLSVDGYEMHLATCHLAHLLLTRELLELLHASAPARIICISSDAHKAGPGLDFEDINNVAIWGGKPISHNAAFQAYHRAKLCNIYMTLELAERIKDSGVTINAVSPGYFVNTTIYRNMRGIFGMGASLVFGTGRLLRLNTAAKGARTHIFLASAAEVANTSGRYFEHGREKAISDTAGDPQLRKKTWAVSEQLIEQALRLAGNPR